MANSSSVNMLLAPRGSFQSNGAGACAWQCSHLILLPIWIDAEEAEPSLGHVASSAVTTKHRRAKVGMLAEVAQERMAPTTGGLAEAGCSGAGNGDGGAEKQIQPSAVSGVSVRASSQSSA